LSYNDQAISAGGVQDLLSPFPFLAARLLQARRDNQGGAAAPEARMVAALALAGSGTGNSKSSRSMIEFSMPAGWRHSRPKINLSISPTSMPQSG